MANNLIVKKEIKSTDEYEQQAIAQFSASFNFLRQHLTFSITLLYFVISTYGLIYIYYLSKAFRIDILPHIDFTDFILAPVHFPEIVFFVVTMVTGGWVLILLERLGRKNQLYKRLSDRANRRFFTINPLLVYSFIVGVLIFTATKIAARDTHEDIIAGNNQKYTITFAETTSVSSKKVNYLSNNQIIADTVKYLWLYNTDTLQIHAIPQKNVASLLPMTRTK